MVVTCSWCQRELGEKEPAWDRRTTHGICIPCSLRLIENWRREYETRRDQGGADNAPGECKAVLVRRDLSGQELSGVRE